MDVPMSNYFLFEKTHKTKHIQDMPSLMKPVHLILGPTPPIPTIENGYVCVNKLGKPIEMVKICQNSIQGKCSRQISSHNQISKL